MNSPVNILLVDDEVRNLDALESILESSDYRLVRAQTANEALMALVQHEFAAIVLDIQMPDTSGIELARLIKTRKRSQHVPIIFLTAYFQQDEDILQGYGVGAVDYLTKPFKPQILKSKVDAFVNLFRITRALEQEIAQRRLAEEALRQANTKLETRVQERTADLSRANRDLRVSEERYRLILENALEYAVFTADKDGRVTTWNSGAQRILGFEETEIIGQRLDVIFTAEDREHGQLDLEMGRALTNGRAQDERWHVRRDGSLFWATGLMMVLKDEGGAHLGFLKILRDRTNRKHIDEALRESEARFRSMADTTPVLIWMAGPDKLCTYFNKPWLEFTGRTLEQELGNGWADGVHPDELERCMKIYVESFEQRVPFEMDYRLRHADGAFRWINNRGTPRFTPDGTFLGYVGGCIDITQRKRAEEANAHLAAIFQSSNDAIISKNLNGIIQSWNPAAQQIFGYSATETVGQPITMLIPPERLTEENEVMQRLRRGEGIEQMETVRLHKSGARIEVSLTISPVRDAEGRIVGASKIARDITDRKRSEQRAVWLNETLLSMMEAIPDIVFVTEAEGGIQFKNRAAARFAASVAPNGQLPAPVRSELERVFQTGEHHLPTTFKTVHRFAIDREERFFLNRIVPLTAPDERIFGAVVMLQDVTEFRLLDEVKTNLIATVSHELKTPMTSLRTALLLLQEQSIGPLNARQSEMAGIARDESERLLRTLNELLDLTRFEESAVGMRAELVSPEELIQAAVGETRMAAETARISVRLELPPDLPSVLADRERIVHVLTNFLTNALKYSPEGSEVLVSAERNDQGVSFSVIDRGPGVPREYQSRIFEKFVRVPGNSKKGVGLGLFIAREFVRAHKGWIGVRSEPGNGSDFYFILPVS